MASFMSLAANDDLTTITSSWKSGMLSEAAYRTALLRWTQIHQPSVSCHCFKQTRSLYVRGLLDEEDYIDSVKTWAIRILEPSHSSVVGDPGTEAHLQSSRLAPKRNRDIASFFKPSCPDQTEKKTRFLCRYCSETFGNRGALATHERCKHTVQLAEMKKNNSEAFRQMFLAQSSASSASSSCEQETPRLHVMFPPNPMVVEDEEEEMDSQIVTSPTDAEKKASFRLACRNNRGSDRRVRLSLGQKSEIIHEIKELVGRLWKEPAAKQEVSARYHIPTSTISRIWQNRSAISDKAVRNKKAKLLSSIRPPKYVAMENELFRSFQTARWKGRQVSERWLRITGKRILDDQVPNHNFRFSHGWVRRFLARRNIAVRKATNAKAKASD